jgi:hypothetical protein
MSDRQTDRQADRQAGRRAGGQAGRRAGGQAGRRAGGQAGRRAGGQAGRQTHIFELTPINMGNFFLISFCVWEGKNKWGEIYTSLLTMPVSFAHCSAHRMIREIQRKNLKCTQIEMTHTLFLYFTNYG